MDEVTTEREFWHTMSTSNNFSVQYANDIEGTASSSFGAWDLSKMPTSSSCLLNLLPDLIPGVTTPMLYIGMLFAHFCWHYEDNALYRSFLANLQIRVALHREFPVRGLRNLCSLSGCFEHNDSQWSISSKCID